MERIGSSRFTHQDLAQLAQSSVKSPLRVIALIDYDAFYAQCESVRLSLNPDIPLAVQQWDAIIALNYAARQYGIKRAVSVEEARSKCPALVLQHVATWREGDTKWAYRPALTISPGTDKAALDPYRLESRKSLELIKRELPAPGPYLIEKASVDEVFIDLSAQVHGVLLRRYPALHRLLSEPLDKYLPRAPDTIINWQAGSVFRVSDEQECHHGFDWDDIALGIGSEIVADLRRQIFSQLRYTCSAGIARNKALAKLASEHNKPNHQTVVLRSGTAAFLSRHKLRAIRGLGRDLGERLKEQFQMEAIPELLEVPLSELQTRMGVSPGQWIYDVIRGRELSEVVPRTHVQTMLSAKTFLPKIQSSQQAEKWLRIFVADLFGRLDEQASENHQVRPTTVTLYHHIDGRFGPTRSRQTSIPSNATFSKQSLFNLARMLLAELTAQQKSWPCRSLSLRISGFQEVSTGDNLISSYFGKRTEGLYLRETGLDARIESQGRREPLQPAADAHEGNGQHSLEAHIDDSSSAPSEHYWLGSQHVGFYFCPHCEKQVDGPKVLEHLDWHVAVQLSTEHTST